jgi:hypothetical protein
MKLACTSHLLMHPHTANNIPKKKLEAEVLSFTKGQALDSHTMGLIFFLAM